MKRTILLAGCLSLTVLPTAAPADAPLSGVYHYQYLRVGQPGAGSLPDVRSQAGRASFDPAGRIAYEGGAAAYMVDSNGFARLGGPADRYTSLNARVAADATVILGSSTESSGLFDLFIAVKAATSALPTLTGTYRAATLVFPASRISGTRSGFVTLPAADMTLRLAADGTGTLTLPLTTPLPVREYNVMVSAGGAFLIGSPRSGIGVFVAAKTATEDLSGLYWLCEMSVERARVSASLGSLRIESPQRARLAQRWNALGGAFDYRGVNGLALQSQGVGLLEQTNIGAGGGSLVGATAGPNVQSILFAVRAPSFAGAVVDAASLAPPGNPVAPGAFVSLFGAGLSARTASAQSLPLPQSLEGVRVEVNSQPAGLHYVSPSQVNLIVPPQLEGSEARFLLRNSSGAALSLSAPLAQTSPGVFALADGRGIVTHADYSLVTPASPARRSEVLVVFATGAGVEQPPLGIWIGGRPAEVLYSGPSSFPGVDQINFRVPASGATGGAVPLTLVSRQGFSDSVDIAITP